MAVKAGKFDGSIIRGKNWFFRGNGYVYLCENRFSAKLDGIFICGIFIGFYVWLISWLTQEGKLMALGDYSNPFQFQIPIEYINYAQEGGLDGFLVCVFMFCFPKCITLMMWTSIKVKNIYNTLQFTTITIHDFPAMLAGNWVNGQY